MTTKQINITPLEIINCFVILKDMISIADTQSKNIEKELEEWDGPTDFDNPEADDYVNNQLLEEDYEHRAEVCNILILELQVLKKVYKPSDFESVGDTITREQLGDIVDLIDNRFGLDQDFKFLDVLSALREIISRKSKKKKKD
ncbi:MAG TPA: hypothetical protein P5136_01575 [Methanofastidiosum sp.]|nr:hypothetical protein [Methanofastidiosum sp.]